MNDQISSVQIFMKLKNEDKCPLCLKPLFILGVPLDKLEKGSYTLNHMCDDNEIEIFIERV